MSRGNRSRARGRQTGERRAETGDRRRARAFRSPTSNLRPPLAARPVRIHNGHPRLRFDRRAVAAVIRQLDAHAAEIVGSDVLPINPASRLPLPALPGVPAGELSLAFLTDPALARLHAAFLGDRSPTDVITFAGTSTAGPAPMEPGLAGEICVSADAARTFAANHGRDFAAEMTLYLAHGWLHLAGYDDLTPAAKKRMRAAEARAMALLRERRLIPGFALAG